MNEKDTRRGAAVDGRLPRGIIRVCSGLLECCQTPEVLEAIALAEQEVGAGFASNRQAQESRRRLVKAIKLNVINQKRHPFEELKRRYDLPMEERSFRTEKKRFCRAMAKDLKYL